MISRSILQQQPVILKVDMYTILEIMSGNNLILIRPQLGRSSHAGAAADEEKESSHSRSDASQDYYPPLFEQSNELSVTAECDMMSQTSTSLKVEANATWPTRRASPQQDGHSPPPHLNNMASFDAPPSTREQAKTPSIHQAYTSIHNSRRNLMVLIQIMLKYLDYIDPKLCVEVKNAVADCTKKNREGHPAYRPLVDVITRRLRLVVGDMHWSQLETLMEHYMEKRATAGISGSSDSPQRIVAV